MLLDVLAFVVVFGVMVLAHEFGHFLVARLAGVPVEEFGIGYPPRVKTIGVRNGTEYTLNAIPFGGFVRLYGEGDPSIVDGFANRSARVRIATFLAGPLMNVVLAAVMFVAAALFGEQVAVGKVVVESVAPQSPAAQAGLQQGDILLEMDGRSIENVNDLVDHTQTVLGHEVSLRIQRGDQSLTAHLTPRTNPPTGEGAMGVVVTMQAGYAIKTVHYPIATAVGMGLREVWTMLLLIASGFLSLFRVGLSSETVAGPVGILQLSGAVARTGVVNLMRLTGMLSINLFIVNLVPLPVLDGGQVLSVLLEKLRGGKRFAPRQEEMVRILSWVLLLSLMLLVSYFDIVRLSSGKSLLP